MRLKPLVGLIMKSQTYQLGTTPNPSNAGDTANFARASVRLLPAEVLLDAISQVLDVPGSISEAAPDAFAPPSCRASPGERVPEDVRQARAAAHLRMRADRRPRPSPRPSR